MPLDEGSYECIDSLPGCHSALNISFKKNWKRSKNVSWKKNCSQKSANNSWACLTTELQWGPSQLQFRLIATGTDTTVWAITMTPQLGCKHSHLGLVMQNDITGGCIETLVKELQVTPRLMQHSESTNWAEVTTTTGQKNCSNKLTNFLDFIFQTFHILTFSPL